MSEAKAHGLIANAKRQPGKTATLALLVLMMSFVWGRILLGGEDKKKKSSSSKPVAEKSAEASSSSPSSKAASSSKSTSKSKSKSKSDKDKPTVKLDPIKNFNTAVSRIESWRRPLGIEKAAPLTPEYLEQRRLEAEEQRLSRAARADAAREAGERANQESETGLIGLPDSVENLLGGVAGTTAPSPPPVVPSVLSNTPLMVDDGIEVELNLTGTLILGDTRIALFGDRRVQVGERYGRYLLQAVRAREVDVVVDGKLQTVRMPGPDLEFGG